MGAVLLRSPVKRSRDDTLDRKNMTDVSGESPVTLSSSTQTNRKTDRRILSSVRTTLSNPSEDSLDYLGAEDIDDPLGLFTRSNELSPILSGDPGESVLSDTGNEDWTSETLSTSTPILFSPLGSSQLQSPFEDLETMGSDLCLSYGSVRDEPDGRSLLSMLNSTYTENSPLGRHPGLPGRYSSMEGGESGPPITHQDITRHTYWAPQDLVALDLPSEAQEVEQFPQSGRHGKIHSNSTLKCKNMIDLLYTDHSLYFSYN